ncbi:MAG: NAD(P)-dependent oxidoreductase, partial [Glaciecola sp.]
MKYFPIFVDAEHIHCLLVGAGEVAARKCELLLKTPARVTIVSPWVSETVKRLANESTQIT